MIDRERVARAERRRRMREHREVLRFCAVLLVTWFALIGAAKGLQWAF